MKSIEKIVENINKNLTESYENSIGVVIGTSFIDFLDEIEDKTEIYLKDTGINVIESDKEDAKFVFGKINGKKVIVLFGRLHYNLGYDLGEIRDLIFVLKELGCSKLILANSVGAIKKNIKVGDIATFTDQINLTSRNPLKGYTEKKYGSTFIDMTNPYDEHLINLLCLTAKKEMGIKVKKGTFIEFPGPTAETAIESKFAQVLGADIIGFNVCNEVIAAKYCSLPVVAFALITNYASAFTNNKIRHEDIVYNRKCASSYYLELLIRFIKNID